MTDVEKALAAHKEGRDEEVEYRRQLILKRAKTLHSQAEDLEAQAAIIEQLSKQE